jgi:hypothetical protein
MFIVSAFTVRKAHHDCTTTHPIRRKEDKHPIPDPRATLGAPCRIRNGHNESPLAAPIKLHTASRSHKKIRHYNL